MAIILEATYAKKIGLPEYSSHQFSLTVRTEVLSPDDVHGESQRLYQNLQSAVDRELQEPGFVPGVPAKAKAPAAPPRNGATPWCCSPKQRELICRISDYPGVGREKVATLANERFGKSVPSLNKLEASGLIDELLENYGNKSDPPARRSARYANGTERRVR